MASLGLTARSLSRSAGRYASKGQAQHQFDALRDFVRRAARDGQRIDTVAGPAPPLQGFLEPPSACEEGPLMVVTADGKGVPMRRPEAEDWPKPHHRLTKGEKANKKRMACVGAVYSIDPFARKAEDIIDEVLRDKKAKDNKEHMRYDECLARGYPIVSGVAEGACRHLVKDRMEQAGMRWTVGVAQAMLHVRALYLNDQCEEFLEHRVEQEQTRLYRRPVA